MGNGRFLKKDDESGLWIEIGDDQAREKTSQALRQKAPDFRRQMEEQDRRVIESVVTPGSCNLYFDTRRQTPLAPSVPQLSHQTSSYLNQLLSIRERQLKIQQQMLVVQEMKESLRMR